MPIGSMVGEVAEKIFKNAGEVTERLRSSETGYLGKKSFFAQEEELKRSPEGMKVLGHLKEFTRQRNAYFTDMIKSPSEIAEAIKNDPVKLKSTIGKLHADFEAEKSPLAKHTAKILGESPDHEQMTLKDYVGSLSGKARLAAQQQVGGPDNVRITNAIMPLFSKGADSVNHANAILDIVANQFRDTRYPKTLLEGAGPIKTLVPHSAVKLDMQKAIIAMNKQLDAMGPAMRKYKMNERIDTSSTWKQKWAIEQFANTRVKIFLAPFIAISHLTTFFNNANAPLEAIYKGLATLGDDEMKELTEASSVLSSQYYHMLLDDLHQRTGLLASKTGKPEVASLYGQLAHNPGFNFIRKAQMRYSAAVGYHSAQYWAERAVQGDERSIKELERMQLNSKEIIGRGGQLNREEKLKAMWHFANDRIFIDKPLDRSITATATPYGRLLTMFHGYVTSQQRLIRNEFRTMWEAGDKAGIARYAATIGLVFPSVAPMIKSMEVLARTASPTKAFTGAEEDYRRLTHPEGVQDFVGEYLDALSHFGAMGTMSSFVTAAHGDRLAVYLMGPTAGSAVRAAQDAINLATKSTKTGKRNVKPLARDILQQTVPVGGNILASKLFPTGRR